MEKGISYLLAVMQRRSLPALATFSAVIGGAIAYLTVTPHLYSASGRLILDDKRVSISDLGRDLTQVRSSTPGGSNPLADEAELIKSQRVLKRALTEHIDPNVKPKLTIEDLNRNLSVKIVPATNILQVSYQGKDPVMAAKLVNAVSQAMVEDSTQVIRKEAASAVKFLEKEVPSARNRLEKTEIAENRYRQSSGIIALDDQTKSLVASVAALEEQQRTLSTQLQDAKSRDVSLRQITDAKALNSAYANVRGGQDEELKKLRAKLSELQTQIVEARLRFTEDHPTVIKLVQERNTLQSVYAKTLGSVSPGSQDIVPKTVAGDQISQDLTSKLIVNEIERSAIENKLKVVQSDLNNLHARLAALPMKQQPLTALVRTRQEATESVKLLQSKLEEARIAEAQLVGNIQIIEAAQPPTKPTSPKQKVVLVVAAAFGSVLAIGIVLLLEVMDNTLRDAAEAEELLKLPLLGVLPRLTAQTLSLAPAERFLDNVGFVEPYRMLFKTLEFRNSDQLRSLVVTSTISGEGKSVVASHLAAVAAMLSWRTLIIDADLRRPVQHNLFKLFPKPGITDVIEGELSLQQAVQATEIENLDILTCGELRRRPSQLLDSVAMKSLIEDASQEYDLVIIDTPPLSACADASSLSRHCDGVVLVTRPGFTLKEVLSRAVSELTRNRIPVLGMVVNGMTNLTEKYYRYPVNGYQPKKRLTGLGGYRQRFVERDEV
ncbi:MAG: polysaccharide biosynthesis tyrosine autokinase [Rhizonema sp. NSF051]|nr:polysaccharide biosynthesis tyrosine autokinase [Rhizonema sp. NSF051]